MLFHGNVIVLLWQMLRAAPTRLFFWLDVVILLGFVLLNSLSAIGLWCHCRWGYGLGSMAVLFTTALLSLSYWPGLLLMWHHFYLPGGSQSDTLVLLCLGNGAFLAWLVGSGLASWRRNRYNRSQ